MKSGEKLFVRIDHRIAENPFGPNDFQDHFDYLQNIAKERTFLGGGFTDKVGGMIVFEAKSWDEARKISDQDPLIARNLYYYELHEWELAIVSE